MIRWAWMVLGVALAIAAPGFAQQKAPAEPQLHPILGPAKVVLGADLATVDLADEFAFLNAEETKRLLKQNTGVSFDTALGMIVPRNGEDFSVLVQYEDIGYVKDDDAGKLDAKGIFNQLKEGNDEANEERKEAGFPPLELVKWSEEPRYEQAQHHMVWGLVVKGSRGQSVNFNTRILGRGGVLSMNLVSGIDKIEQYKPKVAGLLKATSFKEGKRYADFVPGKDKASDLNLTGLVIGGTALAVGAKLVKMGFLAKLFAPLLKLLAAFWKLIAVGLAWLVSQFNKVFGGKKKQEEPPPPPPAA